MDILEIRRLLTHSPAAAAALAAFSAEQQNNFTNLSDIEDRENDARQRKAVDVQAIRATIRQDSPQQFQEAAERRIADREKRCDAEIEECKRRRVPVEAKLE